MVCIERLFVEDKRGGHYPFSTPLLLGSPLLIDISESKKIPFLSSPHTHAVAVPYMRGQGTGGHGGHTRCLSSLL